jgi:hypothetical protein
MMDKTLLSPQEAFTAMRRFLEAYYTRTGESGELASVLSDLQPLPSDALPADPAAWEDWLAAVRAVKAGQQSGVTAPEGTPRYKAAG